MTDRKSKTNHRKEVHIDVDAQSTKEQTVARQSLRPTVQAAVTLQKYNKDLVGELGLRELMDALSEQTKAVIDGDLDRGEAMLTAQAHTLDAIFNELARRAVGSEFMNQFEPFLKLSLKAQAQCRSTWEAVSAIKNPPIAYIKQANIAQLQQVNNGIPHAGEKEILQNELLEQQHHERLDTRTTRTPIEADSAMAALEAVHGAKKP